MKSDLDRVMEIMAAAFDPRWREPWTRRQVEDALLLPYTDAIVVDDAGDIVAGNRDAAGFLLARRTPGEVELLLIAVHPEHRRRGIGAKLLRRLAENARAAHAERVFLEMREGNPAESLYLAAGYQPVGRRKAYYTTTEGERIDAITFALSLY